MDLINIIIDLKSLWGSNKKQESVLFMKNLDVYGDELIEGDPTEKHITSPSVGNNAIRDAFNKANYDSTSLPEVNNIKSSFKVRKPIIFDKVWESKASPTEDLLANDNTPYKATIELAAEPLKTIPECYVDSTNARIATIMKMPFPMEIGCEIHNSHDCVTCGSKFDMSEADEKWFIDKGWPIPKRCKMCRDNKVKKIVVTSSDPDEMKSTHKCIGCGEIFYTTQSHEEWYISKHLLFPTRCFKCITKRKYEKAASGQ